MTIYTKIAVLFLSFSIVGLTEYKLHISRQPISESEKHIFLRWHNDKLVFDKVAWEPDRQNKSASKLPANLRPLFFVKIPVNTATTELLMTLPGVGEKTARQIVTLRSQQRLRNVEELLTIKGIGRKKVKKLRDVLSFE